MSMLKQLKKRDNRAKERHQEPEVTERIESIRPLPASSKEKSPPRSPKRIFPWQDAANKEKHQEEEEDLDASHQKMLLKTRDGFCRRVDAYDGSVLTVEGKPAYELGNYLGGGVAGVVYQGHRLLSQEEYPVRLGLDQEPPDVKHVLIETTVNTTVQATGGGCGVPFICVPQAADAAVVVADTAGASDTRINARDGSLLTVDTARSTAASPTAQAAANDIAFETTESCDAGVIIDKLDAPSRSKHYARAVSKVSAEADFDCDASFMDGFMEETVAIKILNPVGFRALAADQVASTVVARPGAPLDRDVVRGTKPMEEKHVWWLVNPAGRNLRTLQRYSAGTSLGVEVDRGSPERGLRISLVAAYKEKGELKELPLTRCLEIWGHVPFEASDAEFRDVMQAIDRVNQGLPPPPVVPGRVPTSTSSMGSSSVAFEDLKISQAQDMSKKRT
jgi:hypothetical protein